MIALLRPQGPILFYLPHNVVSKNTVNKDIIVSRHLMKSTECLGHILPLLTLFKSLELAVIQATEIESMTSPSGKKVV